MSSHLRVFAGVPATAESVVLPAVTGWCQETFADIPECRSFEDHGIIIWANAPAAGVLSTHKYDFLITAISNILNLWRKNSIAILIHPNRASEHRERLEIATVFQFPFFALAGKERQVT